jgi:hypothetical protein
MEQVHQYLQAKLLLETGHSHLIYLFVVLPTLEL